MHAPFVWYTTVCRCRRTHTSISQTEAHPPRQSVVKGKCTLFEMEIPRHILCLDYVQQDRSGQHSKRASNALVTFHIWKSVVRTIFEILNIVSPVQKPLGQEKLGMLKSTAKHWMNHSGTMQARLCC